MKKIIILFISLFFIGCAFGTLNFGVRKNWKSVKNAIYMLHGQSIEIAKHLYGEPHQIIAKKNDQYIYIWGSETTRIRKIDTIGTKIKANKDIENIKEESVINYDYQCYLALRVDSNNIIIDSFQEGFSPDILSNGCKNLFMRSKNFCKEVKKETKREQNIRLGDCHRNDLTTNKHIKFSIPQHYESSYVYEADHFFNK